jgi:hypothetical protein
VRKIVYPLIWLAVTVTAVLIASAAVSSVRDQVTDTPTAMLPPTTMAISSTDQLVADPIQPQDSDATTTTSPPTSTTAAPEPVTTTPTTTLPPSPDPDPEPAQTTTTTTEVPAPTTTTDAPTSEIRSYVLVGGSVSVEIGDGVVRLAGASPNSGFTMEVEDSGPEKVEVEFHNDGHESKFSGEFEDGEFVPSISESSGEDDD